MGILIAEFLGLLLIIFFCSWALSEAVERLAERWGANFAGSILLGLVTTLPEYLFVFWAVRKGHFEVAIGSATGAAAMLVTLGYGLVILTATSHFSKHPVKVIHLSRTTRIDALYLFVTAIVAVVLGLAGGGLSLLDGVILTVLYLAYVIHLYYDAHKKSRSHHESGKEPPHVLLAVVVLVACGAIIVVVSEPFVRAMVRLAEVLHVPPLTIAIILSPIASEMPEKLTAFLTVRRRGSLAEISICNFIGSKVNHNSLLLAVMPFTACLSGYGCFIPGIVVPAFWMMTALTLVAGFSLSLGRLRHWQGWLFASLYLVLIIVACFFSSVPGIGIPTH